MTLVLKSNLDIVVTYLHTKYEVNRSICSKVMIQKQRKTDRHTDGQTDRQTDINANMQNILHEIPA